MNRKMKLLLLALWLTITVPLIFLGYGVDEDAWRVAKVAAKIWTEGEYLWSRTTGFPLFEISVSPLVHYGKWYLSNTYSLIFGIIIIVFFISLAKQSEAGNPLLVILSIAFSTIVIANATSTMDMYQYFLFLCGLIS